MKYIPHNVLIIGYGNPLRGDDGLGWHISPLIAESMNALCQESTLEVVTSHQLYPEMAEPISQATFVLFLDASIGDVPGTVQCERIVATVSHPGAFTHHCTPASLLALSHWLYGTCPDAVLLSVVGDTFDDGEHLSPAVQAAIPTVLNTIKQLIFRRLGARASCPHAGETPALPGLQITEDCSSICHSYRVPV
jgi:hydrogenase maturation protease